MRLPPRAFIRDQPAPDDLLLVVRGGAAGLSDASLQRSIGDCWEAHGFFGVSVFAAPADDLVGLSEQVPAIS